MTRKISISVVLVICCLLVSGFDDTTGNGKSFHHRIAVGEIPNHTSVYIVGYNPDIDISSAPEDVWSYGGEYTYSETANIDTIVSDNDTDSDLEVYIEGLDTNWLPVTQYVTLLGTAPATLSTSLIRVNHMSNGNGTDFVGNVSLVINGASLVSGVPQTASEVRAYIPVGEGSALDGFYSIPAGYTGYITQGQAGASKKQDTTYVLSAKFRYFGKVFTSIDKFTVSESNNYVHSFDPHIMIPAKSDIKVHVDSTSADNGSVSANYQIILVKD